MKTIPPPCPEPETGPKYWRSLDQWANTPEFRQWVEKEFPHGASEFADPVSRRHFVKLMSASFLLAGMGAAGCRRPEEKIVPFAKMPEYYLHGGVQYYATAMPTRGTAIPLLVKSLDGRPIKIEGNPQHPDSIGGTDHFAQASILNLYDPDRSIRFTKATKAVPAVSALTALNDLARQATASRGKGFSFLWESSSSPSRLRLQQILSQKLPEARWYQDEPVDLERGAQAASQAFGQSVSPYYQLDKAKAILSLDCDFIGAEEDTCRHIRGFAKGRKLERHTDEMSRLYCVEGLLTLTGANADHRLRVPPSAVLPIAALMVAEALTQTSAPAQDNRPAGLRDGLLRIADAAKLDAEGRAWVQECVRDLVSRRRGETIIFAGYQQPIAVHLLAQAMNSILGNIGSTVGLRPRPANRYGFLVELARSLNAGEVDTLIILGGNPVYNAPADLEWTKTQRKAKTVVRCGYYEDETSAVSDWHLPLAHYLESWGDVRTSDGTLVPIQPLIAPMFNGLTELEILARLGDFPQTTAYELVRETFRTLAPPSSFEERWKKFLHDGFLANSASQNVQATFDWSKAAPANLGATPLAAPTSQNLEVVFHRDYSLDDGRFNNNGWLQETPNPITKLTWDNAILVSPATARARGLGGVQEANKGLFKNQIVEISVSGRKIRGPIWVQPGLADNVVALAFGYGRVNTGRIGRRDGSPVGFNAYLLRSSASEYFAAGAALNPTGEFFPLGCTQEHGAMEGRPIVREANKSQLNEKTFRFAKNMDLDSPEHTHHIPNINNDPAKPRRLYEAPPFTGIHQWGMSIDLNACVGCTACVVACQSENNIPIVGKPQVIKGREMSWLRIDRYYAGPPEDPQVVYQPMLCQHCENAPCESVCPVNATTHDEEGLNVMTYNRCVGTRYCSNNCPYKVRRFNYFDYHRRPLNELYKSPFTSATRGEWELKRWFFDPDKGSRPDEEWELLKLVNNPDVTVRMRGVMEKCTFCLQRIQQAKIAQKVKAGDSGDVKIPDGTIKTACEQACPAEAIVFGDVSDPNSRVSKLKKQERDYSVLGFLDTRPRVTYLARIRNPNPKMPRYTEYPLSLKEYVDQTHTDPMQEHGAIGGAGRGGDPASPGVQPPVHKEGH